MIDLTIVIVNYNAGNYLLDCLKSINLVKNEAKIKTIVVDNASVDDSIERAKKEFSGSSVEFILNKNNVGFGRANNQALKTVKSEYVLLLNPDTILEKNVISGMLEVMVKDEKVGASTCKIILPNGSVDLTAHRGFPTPWAAFLYFLGNDSLYHLSKMDMSQIHEVDSISGAFFLSRKSILDKVGYFDEDYFMYAEDIDLCFKIKQIGYKILYNPAFSIVHNKGVSSGLKKHSQTITTANSDTRKKSLDAFYSTMKVFYKKHYQKQYPGIVNFLVYLGIDLRWWLAKRSLTV